MGKGQSKGKQTNSEEKQQKNENVHQKNEPPGDHNAQIYSDPIFFDNKENIHDQSLTEADDSDVWKRYVTENESEFYRGIRRGRPQGKDGNVDLNQAENPERKRRFPADNQPITATETADRTPRNTVGVSRTIAAYKAVPEPESSVQKTSVQKTSVQNIDKREEDKSNKIFSHSHKDVVRPPVPRPERQIVRVVEKQKEYFGHSEIIETIDINGRKKYSVRRNFNTKPIFLPENRRFRNLERNVIRYPGLVLHPNGMPIQAGKGYSLYNPNTMERPQYKNYRQFGFWTQEGT